MIPQPSRHKDNQKYLEKFTCHFIFLLTFNNPIGSDFNNFFQGTIHGLKIFDEALTESEITEVYNEQPYLGVEVE